MASVKAWRSVLTACWLSDIACWVADKASSSVDVAFTATVVAENAECAAGEVGFSVTRGMHLVQTVEMEVLRMVETVVVSC